MAACSCRVSAEPQLIGAAGKPAATIPAARRAISSAARFGSRLNSNIRACSQRVGSLCLRRHGRRRCVARRRAWSWLSPAARPQPMRSRGWCTAARVPDHQSGKKHGCAAQQIHGRQCVAAVIGRAASRLQMGGRPPRQRTRLRFGGPQLTSGTGRTVQGGSRGSPGVWYLVSRKRIQASRQSGGVARHEVTWGSHGKPLPGSGCGGSCTLPRGAGRRDRVPPAPSLRGFAGCG